MYKAERVYTEWLESCPEHPLPREEIPMPSESNERIYGMYTESEVMDLFDCTDMKSAPGPRKWLTFSALKGLGFKCIALILNSWWASRRVPLLAKECRTILIFKKGVCTEVGNWWPIMIMSMLLHLYTKSWDIRLCRMVALNERQKAFVPLDSCFENVRILQKLIKKSLWGHKNLSIFLLYLAKAFDTIRHDLIVRALERKQVPEEVIQAILDTY